MEHYQHGQVVNGHRFDAATNRWIPILEPKPGMSRGKKIAALSVGGFLLLGVGAALAGGGSETPAPAASDPTPVKEKPKPVDKPVGQGWGSKDASADVTLGAAAPPDMIGMVYVKVRATNHSEKPSDYWVTVASVRNGVRVGSSLPAVINHVLPGETAEGKAMFTEKEAGDSYKIVEVARTASD